MEREYNPKPLTGETKQDLENLPVESTHLYERPLFKKQGTMNFPEKSWEKVNEGRFQKSNCSRCHHCR